MKTMKSCHELNSFTQEIFHQIFNLSTAVTLGLSNGGPSDLMFTSLLAALLGTKIFRTNIIVFKPMCLGPNFSFKSILMGCDRMKIRFKLEKDLQGFFSLLTL